jgi:3-dehydroquinate synthase
MAEITNIEFIDDVAGFLRELKAHKIILLIDQHVYSFYQSEFEGFDSIIVPSGEQSKNLSLIDEIVQMLLEMDFQRDSLLIGVGGGVVTDIAGFVASVYMRGMRFGLMPTTLLGMCDAAIGGKNGVNSGNSKNMIGTIRQPEFIAVLTGFLETLPEQEFLNGMAEIIKHSIISGDDFFEFLKTNQKQILDQDKEVLRQMIQKSADIKHGIVQKDVDDQDVRHILNLGHTIAHALESLTEHLHGECVAIGMAMDSSIAKNMNLTDEDSAEKMKNLIRGYGLPVKTEFNSKALMEKISGDKKRRENHIRYVLPVAPGDCRIVNMSLDELSKHLRNLENE